MGRVREIFKLRHGNHPHVKECATMPLANNVSKST